MSPARVWLSGEVEIFSNEHLPYAFPALLCLLTLGSIPPVLLLVYPLNSKVTAKIKEVFHLEFNNSSHPKIFHFSGKLSLMLKPFLDTFQGCFKDHLRFFAGLYFIYRWVGLLVYAISPNLSGFYATLQAVLTFILMLHAIAQPYENRWHNVVDSLLLADLTLINGFTGFNYYYTRVTANEVRNQQVLDATSSIQLILIYLPILSMAVYLGCVSYQKYHSWKSIKENTAEVNITSAPPPLSLNYQDCHGTAFCNVPLEEFPARLLEKDAEYEQEDEEEFISDPGLPPNIPPAYVRD